MDTPTTCVMDCPDQCSVLCHATAEDMRLWGNPDHPRTRGFLCAKIRRHPYRLNSPHRIREPWIRRGDRFHSATWEEALSFVSAALERALRQDPASVLHVLGSGSMGTTKAFGDYLFRSLGARTTRGSLCDGAGIAAVVADAGALDMNDPEEIEGAEALILWGKNPKAGSIHTAAAVTRARKRGVPVLAITPDPSSLASLADRVVRIRPGTDRFLALACAKLLLTQAPGAPPWDRAANRPAFERLLEGWTLSDLLAACDAEEPDVRALASVYGGTGRVATIAGWAMQRYPFGGQNVRAVHALAFLAGSLGVPGGGFYFSIPSSRHLRPPQPPQRGAPPLLLPCLARDLGAAVPPIAFAWFTCSNYLNQCPDAKAARTAFASVGTVVAVEAFWTETARHASAVLPPALWLEEEDVVGSYWTNTLGAVRKVIDPPGSCRTDFEILAEVGRRVGGNTPFHNPEDWLRACLPSGGPSLDRLRAEGWATVPWPAVAWREGFGHEDRKFHLLEVLSPEPPPDPVHPYRLLTLIRAEAIHSQMLPEEQRSPLPVRIHPETASRAGLAPGDPVRLVSPSGELDGEVRLDPHLHPEAVACPRGGWVNHGIGVNEATTVQLTDLGETSAYYATPVRLERSSGRAGG